MGDFFAFRYGGKVLKGPSADGTAGQVLTTDGSGVTSFGEYAFPASGLAVRGDPDTLIKSPAPDVLELWVGNEKGLRITESGGVVTWPMNVLPLIHTSVNESLVIGSGASAVGDSTSGMTAIGVNAVAGNASWQNEATAIGSNAECTHSATVAIGANAKAKGSRAIVIGANAEAFNGLAIGNANVVSGGMGAIGLSGQTTAADAKDTFVIGKGIGSNFEGEFLYGSRMSAAVKPAFGFAGSTNQFAGRQMMRIESDWLDDAETTNVKARIMFKVWDTDGREAMRMEADGSRGYLIQKAHATAPADSMLPNSSVAFYDDGSGNLAIKLKDGSGTVKTGTVTLS